MKAVPVDTAPPTKGSLWARLGYALLWLGFAVVLLSFLFPISGKPQAAAQQAGALNNARQIVGALRAYATDHDGKFPDKNPDGSPITSANQAFRVLFPQYLTGERICYVKDSAWTPAEPDDVLDAPGERSGTNTLRPGENHFAYVRGLTDSSNPALPLVADGFTAPAGGLLADPVYRGEKAKKGGRWAGRVSLLVRMDQSAQKVGREGNELTHEDTAAGRVFRVPRPPKTPGAAPGRNLFSPDLSDPTWLQPGQGVVDPE